MFFYRYLHREISLINNGQGISFWCSNGEYRMGVISHFQSSSMVLLVVLPSGVKVYTS